VEIAAEWQHPYGREQAAFPLPWVREAKIWPSVKRIDNAGGDRNLICTCPPMSDYVD
jgi:glycine dehydrogenase